MTKPKCFFDNWYCFLSSKEEKEDTEEDEEELGAEEEDDECNNYGSSGQGNRLKYIEL